MVDVKIREKYQNILNLVEQGATRGERRAAARAKDKMEQRYGDDVKEPPQPSMVYGLPPRPTARHFEFYTPYCDQPIFVQMADGYILDIAFCATAFDEGEHNVELIWRAVLVGQQTIRVQVIYYMGRASGINRITY